LADGGPFSYQDSRRFRRIFPALGVVCAAYLGFGSLCLLPARQFKRLEWGVAGRIPPNVTATVSVEAFAASLAVIDDLQTFPGASAALLVCSGVDG